MYLQLIACLCRMEIFMNQKGNQKHLTFEQRVEIEKGLTENKSFSAIAKLIGKDPSTISKEVRLHAHTKERPDSRYTSAPCINRKKCEIVCLCDEQCGVLMYVLVIKLPNVKSLPDHHMYVMAVAKNSLSYAKKVLFFQVCT